MNRNKIKALLIVFIFLFVGLAFYSFQMVIVEGQLMKNVPINVKGYWGIIVIEALLLITYFFILKASNTISSKEIYKVFIVIAGIAILINPTSSCDLFYYISYALVDMKYHLNPYTTTILQIRDHIKEPVFWLLTGATKYTPMTYGIFYVFILKLIYILAFGNQLIIGILLKGINAICLFLFAKFTYAVIREMFPNKISKEHYFSAILLNPIFIIQYIGNGHNDIIAAMVFSAGLYLLYKEKFLKAGVLLIVCFFIKPVFLFVYPLIFIFIIKKIKKANIWLLLFLSGLVPILIAYALYGVKLIPQGLKVYSQVFKNNTFYAPYAILQKVFPTLEVWEVTYFMKYIGLGIIVFLILLYICTQRDKSNFNILLRLGFTIYLVYIITSPIVFEWYIIWIFPFLLFSLEKNRALWYRLIGLTSFGFIIEINYLFHRLGINKIVVFNIIGTLLLTIWLCLEITNLIRKQAKEFIK